MESSFLCVVVVTTQQGRGNPITFCATKNVTAPLAALTRSAITADRMTVRDVPPAEILPRWIQRYVEIAILPNLDRYSAKHQCNHTHVAFICRRRKIIAIGQNRVKSRGPFSMIHAEADAIQSLGDAQKLRGATLVVIRVSPHGLKYSRPCEACQRLLDKCQREHGLAGCIHS